MVVALHDADNHPQHRDLDAYLRLDSPRNALVSGLRPADLKDHAKVVVVVAATYDVANGCYMPYGADVHTDLARLTTDHADVAFDSSTSKTPFSSLSSP